MAQANAIIVRIRADAAEEFERLFEEEELPIWDEFVSEGMFLRRGSLAWSTGRRNARTSPWT